MSTLTTAGPATGDELMRRREALGMTRVELADEAGINRATLAKLEAGEAVMVSKRTKVERALDALESEAGATAPAATATTTGTPLAEGLFEFEVTGAAGVTVVVRGPVASESDLLRVVGRLVNDLSGESSG